MPNTDGPLTLYAYARNVLVKYINSIEDVGDMEYRILEPVLKKITSPHQLKKLEANSPQIAGEDVELWKKFIARDFGIDAVDKFSPKNPKSWSKVYDKHQKEATLAQERAAEALKAQFSSLNSAKEGGRTQVLDPSRLPPVRRSKPWGSSGGGGGSSGGWGPANNWDAKVGSKTKNIIQKARREAKEIARRNGTRVPDKAKQPPAVVSALMRQKIKTVEEIRSERDKIAEESRRGGRESGMMPGKRKIEQRREEVEQDDDEAEEERRRKAGERRTFVAAGPKVKAAPEKKAVDPFFRPKKVNPLAMPSRRR
ncbi:hypothetical protein K440DRAFT_131073 [Wilcoxina mikolae CBS 423.85]|nr:hypothetical protein K440DRAFT_131073 [Wilcoxina mikolae CBS 423.85]